MVDPTSAAQIEPTEIEPETIAAGMADRLKRRTRTLHGQAERSGVTAQILRGEVSKDGYVLLLRALAPIYQELEAQLARRSDAPGLRRLADFDLRRSAALSQDLNGLAGPGWPALAPPAEAQRYVRQIQLAAEDGGARLIAHAYVRYLGDLNGGQALARLLARSLGLGAETLNFYRFAGVDDLPACRLAYRAAIDAAGAEIDDVAEVVEEAALAFQLNIDLSEAVLRAVSGAQAPAVARTAVESDDALA